MTRDFRPAQPLDEATIERLVRDVAEGWTMPPVRLDAPSWRERVQSPRSRRTREVRGWFQRLGRAATGAVALTVVAALAAVFVSRVATGPGQSAAPSGGDGTPAPSEVAYTPLPKLLLGGEMPSPSTVLLELDQGDFALADLRVGVRGDSLTPGAAYGSVLQRRADGTLLCLCAKTVPNETTQALEAEISIDRLEPDGTLISSVSAAHLVGEPDPRDVGRSIPERPPHLLFELRISDGGRFGIIGWSVREHPVWRSGVTIVDLADGREVSRIDLPDANTGEGDTRRVVTAPRLHGDGVDGRVVIDRAWYSWFPADSETASYSDGVDVFTADLAGGVLSNQVPLPGATGCGEHVLTAGPSGDGGTWLGCFRAFTSTVVLRRLDAAGNLVGDTPTASAPGVDGDVVAASADGTALFVWNPITATLTRIDVRTGAATSSQAAEVAIGPPDAGPLAGLGAWLAPSTAAKTYLRSGVVVSPDGTRVYAAGVVAGSTEAETGGSSGVFVFDAATLASLGRWQPTADFISLAVSADGRHLYAAGLARFDASGRSRPTQQASVTVFDTATGEVQLIAGELRSDFMTFADPVVR